MGGQIPKDVAVKRQSQSKTLVINSWAMGELGRGSAVLGPKKKGLVDSLPSTVNHDKGGETDSRAWETK